MTAVIAREAGDKTKGFRFQKLRACIRLLNEIIANKNKRVFCAIELLEDSILIEESGPVLANVEENKNYSSALSFNSEPVRNTVIAFIDIDFRFFNDESVKLSFFASATVGGERFSLDICQIAGVPQNSTKILKKLSEKQELTQDELKLCRVVIIEEYKKQYSGRTGGHLVSIEKWNVDDVQKFLSRIDWIVTNDGNDELEAQALSRVTECPFFTHKHTGLEAFILAEILHAFEKNSENKYPTARLLSGIEIENIYLKALGQQTLEKPLDPAHNSWSTIDAADFRNLQEKIKSVTPSYPTVSMIRLNRRVALAKDEAITWGREYVSLRRRLYDVCENILAYKQATRTAPLSQTDIDMILDEMVTLSMRKLEQLGQTYYYRISDEETLRGAVLSLFDECYLAFD